MTVTPYLPFFFASIAVLGSLGCVYYLLLIRNNKLSNDKKFPRQMLFILLAFVAFWVLILFLPIEANAKGQLSTILGIVFSALFALSSTTLLANLMAGIVIRISQPFSVGDFIHIDDFFGRVSERGLFNTELQTEERAFVSIPNAYLIKTPLSARHASGTMVSVNLSLGYDLHHKQIEQLLNVAATKVGLEKPFVHILALGDFSISYRVSGLLVETKQYVSAKSRLFASVLDELHAHKIEILSPNYMAQRPTQVNDKVIPPDAVPIRKASTNSDAETVVFDKAEKAQNIEHTKKQTLDDIKKLKQHEKEATTAEEKSRLANKIADKNNWLSRLNELEELLDNQ